MNKELRTIFIISIAVFGGVFLVCQSAQAGVVPFGGKNIFVDFDGLPFNLSSFAPGMSDKKSIVIHNKESFGIDVYFGAKKNSETKNLSSVLTINISQNSTQISNNHLSDLFSNNVNIFSVNSNSSEEFEVEIIFDPEAGNEYQDQSINFNFAITIEQIGENGEGGEIIIPGGGGGTNIPASTPSPLSEGAQAVDANNDDKIDILDFNILMINWGSTSANNIADFNSDGKVDIFDFNLLMIHWANL